MKRQVTPETTPIPPVAKLANVNSIDTVTLDLLASWRAQDATDDPEALRVAEQELAEFKRAMNENRTSTGEAPLYP